MVNVRFYINSSEAIVWHFQKCLPKEYEGLKLKRHTETNHSSEINKLVGETALFWIFFFFGSLLKPPKETWSLKRRAYHQDAITSIGNVKHVLLLGILLDTSKSQMTIWDTNFYPSSQ